MEWPKWNKVAILAAIFTASMLAINYLFTFVFGSTVKSSLFAITSYPSALPVPVQTFGTGIASTLLGWIGQYVALPNFGTIILLAISAFVLIYAGTLLVSWGLPVLKGQVGKIFSVVAWGTVLGYALMVGLSVPSNAVQTIIGLSMYTLAASYIAALAGNAVGQDL